MLAPAGNTKLLTSVLQCIYYATMHCKAHVDKELGVAASGGRGALPEVAGHAETVLRTWGRGAC